jgi:diguanylate cyclase (GGDEF)-like protein/PAS domain S-box-containing protein
VVALSTSLVGCAVWLAMLATLRPIEADLVLTVVLFFTLAVVAEFVTVPLQGGGGGGVIAVSTIVHVAGILLLPLPVVVILAGAAVLIEQSARRSAWYKASFNTASTVLTVSLVGVLIVLVGNPLHVDQRSPLLSVAILFAAALTYHVATSTLLATLISRVEGLSFGAVIRAEARPSGFLETSTAIIGGLAAFIWHHSPWWTLAMVVPATLTFLSLRYLYRVVTEQRKMEEALRRSEERFRNLVQNASDVVAILDPDGTIRYVSPSVFAILGRTPDEMVGLRMLDFLDPAAADDSEQFSAVQSTVRGSATSRVRLRHADGTYRDVEMILSNQLHEPAIGGIVMNARDVTERRRAEEALAHQALHDELTGLPNRTLLQDRLGEALRLAHRRDESLALLVMDLDRFKEVNDTLGHHAGDLLLRQVAQRLRGALRACDTVARLGGDEFAVLLPDTAAVGAAQTAERLLGALGGRFTVGERILDVGASIGAALCPEHGSDPETLLRRADVAMYVAKREGVGCVLYSPEQDQHTDERLELVGELRAALERDALLLHFQPKVDLKTAGLAGVEALVRWEHPRRGMIPPDRFVALAEQTGLIAPLTRWVLNAALRQCRAWQDSGLDIPIAVNISMRNLQDTQLPRQVAELLAHHGVLPSRLEVEITESAIMADPGRALETLRRLRELGVRIAIDDYGTGYSSLAYLKKLAAHELKIDRSFVTDVTSDENDLVIVRSTIELGHNLGLLVVAEGVEDQATYELLAELGCDQVQGFHVARPLPAAELDAWVAQACTSGARRPGWLVLIGGKGLPQRDSHMIADGPSAASVRHAER